MGLMASIFPTSFHRTAIIPARNLASPGRCMMGLSSADLLEICCQFRSENRQPSAQANFKRDVAMGSGASSLLT
jgi:hypothetical protein